MKYITGVLCLAALVLSGASIKYGNDCMKAATKAEVYALSAARWGAMAMGNAHSAQTQAEKAGDAAVNASGFAASSENAAQRAEANERVAAIEAGRAKDHAKMAEHGAGSTATLAMIAEDAAADAQEALRKAELIAREKFHSIPSYVTSAVLRLYSDRAVNATAIIRYSGSGVVVDRARGLVLTAGHLWEADPTKTAVSCEIREPKLRAFVLVPLKLLFIDRKLDLAIAQSDVEFASSAEYDLDSTIEVNDPTFVVGCPSGSMVNVSLAWLSDKGEDPRTQGPELTSWGLSPANLWQSSNAIYGGNSGGAVFNAKTGKLIGILVAGTNAPNLALFVPLIKAKAWLAGKL